MGCTVALRTFEGGNACGERFGSAGEAILRGVREVRVLSVFAPDLSSAGPAEAVATEFGENGTDAVNNDRVATARGDVTRAEVSLG